MGNRALPMNNSVFKNRNFILLLIGQIMSNLGNAIHSVSVVWYILNIVGEGRSGFFIAIFTMCTLIPSIIFGPISGVYVDKLDRKKIIWGTDLIRGSLIILLGILTYYKVFPLIALFTITALSSFFGTFFNPAVDSSIPNIVDEKNLMTANSVNGMSRQVVFIFGAAIAGFLYYSIGIVGIFIVNGISFTLSGISEMFIKLPSNKKDSQALGEIDFWSDFKSGIEFVKGQKVILILLSFALVLNFLINPIFTIIFPKTIKFTLGLGAKEFGWFQAIFSVGAIAGMLVLSILPKREKNYKLVLYSLMAQSLIQALFGIPIIPMIQAHISNYSVFIIFCVLSFSMMVFNSLINVPIFTVFQKRVPDEYRGRFFGMLNTLSQGIVPLGLMVIGFLSDIVHPSAIFIAAGLISLALTICMAFIPELKEL